MEAILYFWGTIFTWYFSSMMSLCHTNDDILHLIFPKFIFTNTRLWVMLPASQYSFTKLMCHPAFFFFFFFFSFFFFYLEMSWESIWLAAQEMCQQRDFEKLCICRQSTFSHSSSLFTVLLTSSFRFMWKEVVTCHSECGLFIVRVLLEVPNNLFSNYSISCNN